LSFGGHPAHVLNLTIIYKALHPIESIVKQEHSITPTHNPRRVPHIRHLPSWIREYPESAFCSYSLAVTVSLGNFGSDEAEVGEDILKLLVWNYSNLSRRNIRNNCAISHPQHASYIIPSKYLKGHSLFSVYPILFAKESSDTAITRP
jgi:hypothetical protein